MRLRALLRALPEIDDGGAPDVEITAVTADSRRVTPGALFVAVRGTQVDGHAFLADAARRGAAALVGEAPDPGLGVPYLRVADARRALALLAAAWHDFPGRRLVLVGVTGTDGKTTTANLLDRILQAAGLASGLITTVNARIGDEVLDTGLHTTTPGPLEVQGYLARMVAAGLTHCVLEATSHGLAQHRVTGCDFDLAVYTNITHEHLDFHGSRQAYFEAKARLIDLIREAARKPGVEKGVVLNRDDESFAFLEPRSRGLPRHLYGLGEGAQVRGTVLAAGAEGLRLLVEGPGYRQEVRSPLVGRYNAWNILAAYTAAVHGLGLDPAAAAEGVAALQGVPGRMEPIDLGQPFTAIVDFAHTPNALRRALETARELTEGRVLVVFGSAGLRDREKRRLMAEVAVELADLAVFTAEDPRTEPLEAILEEMAHGARARGAEEGRDFVRIPDRGEAIRFAVAQARPGDLVMACGKGHEQSMCFGETEYPWDDRVAMRAALAEHLGVEGPAMPFLPTSEQR